MGILYDYHLRWRIRQELQRPKLHWPTERRSFWSPRISIAALASVLGLLTIGAIIADLIWWVLQIWRG